MSRELKVRFLVFFCQTRYR